MQNNQWNLNKTFSIEIFVSLERIYMLLFSDITSKTTGTVIYNTIFTLYMCVRFKITMCFILTKKLTFKEASYVVVN